MQRNVLVVCIVNGHVYVEDGCWDWPAGTDKSIHWGTWEHLAERGDAGELITRLLEIRRVVLYSFPGFLAFPRLLLPARCVPQILPAGYEIPKPRVPLLHYGSKSYGGVPRDYKASQGVDKATGWGALKKYWGSTL